MTIPAKQAQRCSGKAGRRFSRRRRWPCRRQRQAPGRWLAAVIVAAAWLSMQPVGATAEDYSVRNAKPLVINLAPHSQGLKRQVFILYSCENSLDEGGKENYGTINEWLSNSDYPSTTAFAGKLTENDVRLSCDVQQADLSAIVRCALGPDVRHDVSLAIFTNRLARGGEFRCYRAGSGETLREEKFKVPQPPDAVYREYPLSNPQVFQAALDAVGEIFDSRNHEFVLQTVGHGSGTQVVMPANCVDIRTYRREVFVSRLRGSLAGTDHGAPLFEPHGIPKEKYIEILRAAGDGKGMYFPVVFSMSCRSALPAELEQEITRQASGVNIGKFYAATGGIPYRWLDYDEVFEGYPEATSFADAFDRALYERYLQHK